MSAEEKDAESKPDAVSEGYVTLDIPLSFHKRMKDLQKAWRVKDEMEVLRKLLFPTSIS